MVLYVHGNPIRLIRDGRREVSGEEGDYKKIYLSPHSVSQPL